MERTIPKPNEQDRAVVCAATREAFKTNGLDFRDVEGPLLGAMLQIMRVQAAQRAEIRWLNELMHGKCTPVEYSKATPTGHGKSMSYKSDNQT